MTDIEHSKKYAEESISLTISMFNPKAEIIAETACLYGLTYKNKQLIKAKELLNYWANSYGSIDVTLCKQTMQFLKEIKENEL